MEGLLTLEEASRYLKINRMTLYKMAWEGNVPAYKVGRQWRFRRSALDKWLEESKVSPKVPQYNIKKQKNCVFLTGATGYLGSNLIPKLIKDGFSLKLLVRTKKDDSATRVTQALLKGYEDSAKVSKLMGKIEILEGDVTKKDFGLSKQIIQQLSEKISDVFHCAAAISFDAEKESMLRKNNIEGTRNLLEFFKKLDNPHLHYMSTAYVCGQRKDIVKEDELDVGQTFNNTYENIKCDAEKLVHRWTARHNFKTTVYRPSVIVGDSKTGANQSNYGPYGILRIIDLLMRKFKQEYKRGNPALKKADIKFEGDKLLIPIRVIGKYEKALNLINVDYALEAIMRIFKYHDNIGKTYHITNPNPPSVGLLKDCLSEVLDVKGIRFVDPEVFKKEPMKSWEKLFNKNIGIYTPYLLVDEPEFDDTNTQIVLKNSGLKQLDFDKELVMKLLAYSHSTNYGKNTKKIKAAI